MRIEKDSRGAVTRIRLIGHFQSEHVEELKALVRDAGPVLLDLKEVTLVDVEVVRFLATCRASGVRIANGSQYIREWMAREDEH